MLLACGRPSQYSPTQIKELQRCLSWECNPKDKIPIFVFSTCKYVLKQSQNYTIYTHLSRIHRLVPKTGTESFVRVFSFFRVFFISFFFNTIFFSLSVLIILPLLRTSVNKTAFPVRTSLRKCAFPLRPRRNQTLVQFHPSIRIGNAAIDKELIMQAWR